MLRLQRPLFQIGALCSGRMWLSNWIVMDAEGLKQQDWFIMIFSNDSMATCLYLIWIFKCFLNNFFADQKSIPQRFSWCLNFNSAVSLRTVFDHKWLWWRSNKTKDCLFSKIVNKILMFCLSLRRLFCEFLIQSFLLLVIGLVGFFRYISRYKIKALL